MQETLSKRLLFLAAAAIVVVTLGYTQHLASIIRDEEQRKVDLWVEAVKQRAELVTYTQSLFEDLGAEEKKRADRLAAAYRLIQEAPDGTDLTFAGDFGQQQHGPGHHHQRPRKDDLPRQRGATPGGHV